MSGSSTHMHMSGSSTHMHVAAGHTFLIIVTHSVVNSDGEVQQ